MAHKETPKDNITKYRKPLNLNIGMLIFCAIFIYLIIVVIMTFNTERIIPYEVREGSLAINYTYRAMALRDEQVVTTDKAGYINYFAREGDRVAPGNLVYIIDETGELKEYLDNQSMENTSLSNSELIEIRSDVVNFVHNFDKEHFNSLYDFKYDIKNTVMKFSNSHLYESIDSINNSSLAGSIAYRNAPNTGIITYYIDGYEELKPEDIKLDMFNEEKYTKKQLLDNQLVTADEPAYKLSKNENWCLILPIEEALSQDFLDEEYINVRFLKNQYESWGQVSIVKGADDQTYLQLTFTNSMVTFAKDRFVDIELLLHEETGLKIPNTSIVNKEFYLIPRKYITKMDENADIGSILVETYKEDGTITTSYREIDIYSYDEETEEYYIDSNILQSGSNLLMADSQEKYTVSRKGTLMGVYYMNKGYADFRQIQILYQNDEYSIVKSNTDYGLNVYDYVVLNSETVHEEQFIYN